MVKSVLCYGEMWWTLNVFFFLLLPCYVILSLVTADVYTAIGVLYKFFCSRVVFFTFYLLGLQFEVDASWNGSFVVFGIRTKNW